MGPDPRIIHLIKRNQRTVDDVDWWKCVRSDRRIEGPAIVRGNLTMSVDDDDDVDNDSEYEDFDMSCEEPYLLEMETSVKRLLTDQMIMGTMTREQARDILKQQRGDSIDGIRISVTAVPGIM